MAIKKLIKRFDFGEKNRDRIDVSGGLTLTASIGLTLPRQDVDLGPLADAKPYSLDQDLTARTWVTNPKSLRQWIGFQVDRRVDPASPDPEIEATPVTIRFRLTNGTDDLWHDGAAWSVASDPSHWNTEIEVADNIDTFPLSGRSLGAIVSMFTIDERVAPEIGSIKVLFEADVNEQHDIVYESLVPSLRDGVKSRGRALLVMDSTSSTIDLSDLKALGFQSSYDIIDTASVYNETDDPEKLIDVLSSFDSNTKQITLTGPADQDDRVWINFVFRPEIAVQTTRDYIEISTLPRIDICELSFTDVLAAGSSTASDDSYFHPGTGQGFRIPGPREFDMFAVLELCGDKQFDVTSMREAVAAWVSESNQLTMAGTDESFYMISEGQVDDDSFPNEDDLRKYKMPLSVKRITSHDLPAEPAAAIQSIVFQGGNLEFEIVS